MNQHSAPKTKTSEQFSEPPNTPTVATALYDDDPIKKLGDKVGLLKPQRAELLKKYLEQKGIETL